MAICPECNGTINIPEDATTGEVFGCPDCGESWEYYKNEKGVGLKKAETEGEDWGQ
jgi:alpha-aminoadipate carrier protein LysW